MNKSLIAGLLAVSVVSPVLAFAQTGTPMEERAERREEAQVRMEERQEQREERREERAENMEERKAEFEARREEMKTKMEERKAEFEARREEMKLQFEERKTERQAALAEWKDKKKAEVTERISENLDKVNERLTTKAAEHVAKMSEILNRIEEGDVDGDGATDIAAAETAIEAASDAVEVQAAKTYSLGSVSETTVGSVASDARKQLRTDLEVMMQAVKDAREAVRKAATHIDAREDDESDDDNASSTE